MNQTTQPPIDVRQPPTMIRIGADGQPAADGAPHVAVLLPQYGLTFSVAVDTSAENHAEAVQRAAAVDLLGFSDWRLPDVAELQLLLRRDRHRPAIDADYFPNTPTGDWYWSATPYSSDPASAWSVPFGDGSVGHLPPQRQRLRPCGSVCAAQSVIGLFE